MRKILFFYGLTFYFTNLSFAQSSFLTLTPTKDNTMFSENVNKSSGAGTILFAGRTQGVAGSITRRALLRFDVSGVPNNAVIDSVKLQVSVVRSSNSTTTPHNFTIHKVLNDWGQGTSNDGLGSGEQATTNDATWSHRFYNTPSTWTIQGGDFIATASATTSIKYESFPLQYGVWKNGNIINDILAWIATPASNYGWIIRGEEATLGSAKGFSSREEPLFPKPILTIYYTIPPVEKVLINELNPHKKWVELYNPIAAPTVNLANYWLANGNSVSQINSSHLLNGDLQLLADKYAVLNWSNIGQNDGELALFNGNPATGGTLMKDYVQYGSGNHQRAISAVSAQAWNNASAFLPTISADTASYSLNGNNVYSSGLLTNATDFVIQRQTPSIKNIVCPSSLTLNGNLIDAKYTSIGLLQFSGNASATTNSKLISSQSVLLHGLVLIQNGSVFEAKIGNCWNN